VLSVPEFIQRADSAHLATLGSVVAGTAPAAAYLAFTVQRRKAGGTALGLVIAALALGLVLDLARNTLPQPVSYAVHNDGRTWYYGSRDTANQVRQVLPVAQRLVGQRGSLFVGTADLSRTPRVDDSLYFLLPHAAVRSHFYDFHPGIALHDGRQLALDVLASKTLILTTTKVNEANASRTPGSPLANHVVAKMFHLVDRIGPYSIYERQSVAGRR
jgi:hypothetical protein